MHKALAKAQAFGKAFVRSLHKAFTKACRETSVRALKKTLASAQSLG